MTWKINFSLQLKFYKIEEIILLAVYQQDIILGIFLIVL